jgi:hypothetical protein
VDTGSTRIDVVPSVDGGWHLREPGNGSPLRQVRTEEEALTQARAMLLRNRGGEVHVRRPDGSSSHTYTVKPLDSQPWWYTQQRLLNWLLGPLFIVQGLLHLLFDGGRGPMWWTSWVTLAVGTLYLVSVALSRRRDRRLTEQWLRTPA